MATVGYGDLKPLTTYEKLVCIFILISSTGVYAFIINEVSHIVNNFN